MKIRGILHRPYLCLDDFVDLKAFDRIVPEIWQGIDRSESEEGLYQPGFARPQGAKPHFRQIRIRSEDSWDLKNYSRHCRWNPVSRNFPALKTFIESLPLEEFGRVKLFLNAKDQTTLDHRDHNDTYKMDPELVRHNNEFIWISSHPERRLHLKSDEADEPVIMQGRALFFNEVDLHGSPAFPKRNFSLRVDGKFNSDLRKHFGLPAEGLYL